MQFLFFLTLRSEGLPPNALTPQLIQSEISAVKARLASGKIRDAWMRSDAIGIVVRFDGLTEAECRAIVSTLPFSLSKVLEIERVVPMVPFLEAYP
jgi:hypothetical protein